MAAAARRRHLNPPFARLRSWLPLPPPAYPPLHHPCTLLQLEPLDGPNDGIFWLSLCRPESKNAIGRQFLRELRECLQARGCNKGAGGGLAAGAGLGARSMCLCGLWW